MKSFNQIKESLHCSKHENEHEHEYADRYGYEVH